MHGKNIYEINYEDDHGLDSGAWYKFIKSGLWKDYEYVFFMGEGAILTTTSVLGDTVQFSDENNIHFISGSNHKRFVPKSTFLNGFASTKVPSSISQFNDRMINETYSVFCRDPEFKKVMELWRDDLDPENTPQEHHIPDIWGRHGLFIEKVLNRFPNFRKLHDYYLRLRNSLLVRLGNMGLYTVSRDMTDSEQICFNFKKTKLSDITDFEKCGNTKFHKSKEIGWFGTYCNHFVSTKLLKKLEGKLDEYEIYDAMKLPYSAGPLEPIWGLIPAWLGYKIWFFDGVHRVFKNFLNYDRIDNQEGMARYLNHHFKGILSIVNDGDYLKIKSFNKLYKKRLEKLNGIYFDSETVKR